MGVLAAYRARHPGRSILAMLRFDLAKALIFIVARIVWRHRWTGSHRVPATGPLLIVANHQSYLDPPLIGITITRRHVDFVARGGLFSNPRFGSLIRSVNAFPIKEDGGDAAAIKHILSLLEQGRAVLIFPEGSRSRGPHMGEFKRGIAVLLKRAKCPVLPVAIEGAYHAYPRGAGPKWLGARTACAIGDPIPGDELMRDGPDAALARLHDEVDGLRLRARGLIRRASAGAFPPRDGGDAPSARNDAAGENEA